MEAIGNPLNKKTNQLLSKTNAVLTLLMLFFTVGCSHAAVIEHNTSKQQVSLFETPGVSGKVAFPTLYKERTYWYANSEVDGLRLLDSSGNQLKRQRGHYETLSVQSLTLQKDFLATLNKESGQIELLTYDHKEGAFQLIDTIENPLAQFENQCFHQSSEGYVSLLTIDVRGMVDEWIVYDQIGKAHRKQKLRSFASALNTVACVSNGNSIYLAEEHVGVWSISAHPESDPIRVPVILKSPEGVIKEDISNVAILADKTLVVSSEDSHAIYLLDTLNQNKLVQKIALSPDIKPSSANGFVDKQHIQLVIYDDEGDQYVPHNVSYNASAPTSLASSSISSVQAILETDPVKRYGDAADDPAIWVNALQPLASRILGTDKSSGLSVFDLNGKERQHLNVGRLNNVDIRSGIKIGDQTRSIAAASNRTKNSISLFELNEKSARVEYLTDINTSLDEVYGLCMANRNNRVYVIINDIDGRYQLFELSRQDHLLSAQQIREFRLPSQPEGCVVDDETGYLYMGEENEGIWRTSIDSPASKVTKIISVGPYLSADVEGLAIYAKGESERYLVASSQGNNTYVLYRLDDELTYITRFKVGINLAHGIDGTSETDGLAVTSQPVPGFNKGMLVVQDGRNRLPDAPQNFKVINWENVKALIPVQ